MNKMVALQKNKMTISKLMSHIYQRKKRSFLLRLEEEDASKFHRLICVLISEHESALNCTITVTSDQLDFKKFASDFFSCTTR